MLSKIMVDHSSSPKRATMVLLQEFIVSLRRNNPEVYKKIVKEIGENSFNKAFADLDEANRLWK